jgi:hypothetical protein
MNCGDGKEQEQKELTRNCGIYPRQELGTVFLAENGGCKDTTYASERYDQGGGYRSLGM